MVSPNKIFIIKKTQTDAIIGHFTVVYLVAKPLIWSEAEGDQYLVSIITK